MALVGDVLLLPESGWSRFDDRDGNITYTGTWNKTAEVGYYEETNTTSNSTSSYYEFWFYGTKLRLISDYSNNRSNTIYVNVDGVTETYSSYMTTSKKCAIVYEKLNLTLGFHKVQVRNGTTNYLTLDAIDIDDSGELRYPYDSTIIYNEINDKYYSLDNNTLITLPNTLASTVDKYGLKKGNTILLNTEFNKKSNIVLDLDATIINEDDVFKAKVYSFKVNDIINNINIKEVN